MQEEDFSSILPEIENRIFTIRGLSVMMDSDLAKLYGVETKRINQSVKRNISRFPEWFMFQLTYTEWENLRSQNVTSSENYNEQENGLRFQIGTLDSNISDSLRSQKVSLNEKQYIESENLRSQYATLENKKGKHRKFLPFAFTEQGVAMLSAVFKSETAVKVSIQIIAAFVALTQIFQLASITRKKCCKYKHLLDFLILPYFNMLSTKNSAQTLVFIAFFPFMTIPTEKSGFKKITFSIRRPFSTT